MIVIISNNESEPNAYGERKSSTVYHYSHHQQEWQCKVAIVIKEPIEVEEDLAKAFGRNLCGTCALTKERDLTLKGIRQAVYDTFGKTLEGLGNKLPDNIEIRILAHNVLGRKTPLTIWTSKPKDEEDGSTDGT